MVAMSEKVISDYNGYDYKKIFWEDADREYEDQADRMAIRKLLPKRMEKFADIGGGYGRLANEYLKRARKVYIFDYSKTELAQAKEIYGDKVETKAGDIYKLPFKDNLLVPKQYTLPQKSLVTKFFISKLPFILAILLLSRIKFNLISESCNFAYKFFTFNTLFKNE